MNKIKNRKGLTLIEVILAMLILSILFITYITAFGQNAIFVIKGKGITNETFNYQDIMENSMVNIKKDFTSGGLVKDYEITMFSGEYESQIDVKKVETEITDNRKFIAFVSDFEIKEPKSPKIDPFRVKIYDKYKRIEVFPWKDDKIRLIAEYKVQNDPLIFENRTRWYSSADEKKNPVFASDYEVLSEEEKQEPESGSHVNELKQEKIEAKKFYYFESRAYTFAGRIEHFKNEDRILVLNRAGSKEWQDFMEYVYFDKLNNNVVKRFITNSNNIYLDIMQNPEHPTLNLDWSENKNPEGALVGIKVPSKYENSNFKTSVDFVFDNLALNNSTDLGIGIALVNDNNTGIIIDLEPLEDKISIKTIINGKYENDGLLKEFNTKDDLVFKIFRDKNVGLFDWSKEYSLIIKYHKEKLIIQLENEGVMSQPLELDLKDKKIDSKYIGLKSYSNVDYMPDLKYEIYNKYDRNYSSHFYDIEFENESDEDDNKYDGPWTDETKNIFYSGNSNNIKGNSELNLNIKMTKENTRSEGTGNNILAKAFWFAPEVKKLIIHNHSLLIKAEKVIFDVPIQFTSTSYMEISQINNASYPIKVYFIEGQKIKINDDSVITLKKGQYISIKSSFIKLNSNNDNDSINLTGVDVMLEN